MAQQLRPFTPVTKEPLTEADYIRAAQELDCEVAVVKAVASVESAGHGFFHDGYPKTLFEGHKFSKYTQGQFDATHPTLSYPKWTREFYGKTWQLEQDRFVAACALNRTAAMLSTSFGTFQIMGFNFAACGCTSVNEFCQKMGTTSGAHLDMFVELIRTWGLADELQRKDWTTFARVYNGPGQVPYYAARMAEAYMKASA